jgi:uncharacterized protein (DUF58 family)
MLTKAQNAFENKILSVGRQGQLYIVPTLDGLKLLALNLILLIVGLVYANNYVLLFNFILFCLFIGSMYYTHFNLQGLKLTSAKINPLHVNETGAISLLFKSKSSLGHHFLNVRLKNKLISGEESFSFSMFENVPNQKVEVPIKALNRGVNNLSRINVETKFPFHLFRAFTFFDVGLQVVVYPERLNSALHEKLFISEEKNGSDEDYYLKNYVAGDSLKRVHWKKFAQTGKMFSKQLNSSEDLPVVLGFSADNLSKEEKEKELTSICFGLHELHSQNIFYGLTLESENKTYLIEPGLSQYHLTKCLRVLAEYET